MVEDLPVSDGYKHILICLQQNHSGLQIFAWKREENAYETQFKKEWKKEKRHEKGGKVGKSLDFLKKT